MISAPVEKGKTMTNWKRLYTDVSRMLDKYQNDVVPNLRKQLANRVEVVRCKDCRKCSTWDDVITKQPQYVCRLWHGATREVSADGFCDAGERRTDGK